MPADGPALTKYYPVQVVGARSGSKNDGIGAWEGCYIKRNEPVYLAADVDRLLAAEPPVAAPQYIPCKNGSQDHQWFQNRCLRCGTGRSDEPLSAEPGAVRTAPSNPRCAEKFRADPYHWCSDCKVAAAADGRTARADRQEKDDQSRVDGVPSERPMGSTASNHEVK